MSSIDRPIADGAKANFDGEFADGLWLLNDSTRTVWVEEIGYGYASSAAPLVFPPGTAGAFFDIDNIGPHDPPPGSTVGSFGGATRHWLTWEDAGD